MRVLMAAASALVAVAFAQQGCQPTTGEYTIINGLLYSRSNSCPGGYPSSTSEFDDLAFCGQPSMHHMTALTAECRNCEDFARDQCGQYGPCEWRDDSPWGPGCRETNCNMRTNPLECNSRSYYGTPCTDYDMTTQTLSTCRAMCPLFTDNMDPVGSMDASACSGFGMDCAADPSEAFVAGSPCNTQVCSWCCAHPNTPYCSQAMHGMQCGCDTTGTGGFTVQTLTVSPPFDGTYTLCSPSSCTSPIFSDSDAVTLKNALEMLGFNDISVTGGYNGNAFEFHIESMTALPLLTASTTSAAMMVTVTGTMS